MQYREDKKSGNKLSVLGYGCMRLPSTLGRIDTDKTEKLMMEAIAKGVNYFDTAYIYPESEAVLGQILQKNALREKVYIATKLPLMFCRAYSDFDKYFSTQLERLKTDSIDYYLLHMLSGPAQWQKLRDLGIEKWIAAKKAEGRIGQIGFSFHGKRDDFTALVDSYDWDFCQIQYNYINMNYQAGLAGLKYAAAKGLPVFIMEPLLGGRLAAGLPEKAVNLLKEANPSLSPAAWALRWVWNHPEVTLLLSGMNDFNQLSENLAVAENAAPGMLSEREINTIDKVIGAFNASYKIPCTGCNYCMPCPQNINIPGCFAAYNTSYSISRSTGLHQYMTSTGVASSAAGSAANCIRCGKCEKHCPQSIPIRDSLRAVSKRMEPFWLKLALGIFRRFAR